MSKAQALQGILKSCLLHGLLDVELLDVGAVVPHAVPAGTAAAGSKPCLNT